MKLPKIREIIEAVRALITRPYTTAFPRQAHIPFASFRGKPYFNEKDCVGCAACVNVCPTGALSFKDIQTKAGHKRILKVRWDICIECGQCELNCLSVTGIQLSNEFDASTTEDRRALFQVIEKPLVECEGCRQSFMPHDQMSWAIRKLGRLYTANTSLLAFSQKMLGVRDEMPRQESETLRQDRFRILCPRCRRESVFTS